MNKTRSSKRRFITYAVATATAALTLAGPASANVLSSFHDGLGLTWSSAVSVQSTSQVQETNTSSNLDYLRLQQMMQDQAAQYALLSSIMQAKYDTATSSISNLR